LAVATLVGLAGCSPKEKRVNVSGTVTLGGRPLTEGVVQFHGPGDRLSTAKIQPDGTFVATDILPGDNVQVAIIDDPDQVMSQMVAPLDGSVPPVEQKSAAKQVKIPAKYKSFDTSGLSYTVGPMGTQIEIKLQQ
jgi:hypothetical protein